ncbi:MAG: bifunctional adenosylcobinamide kinase/adenosylcobinamide-phosphate guanylyltransferase, partial [Acidimicrobiia bacterium]
MLTLLTGGARSGKSSAAVRLASATAAPVHYLATAQPGDAEMAQRIARHRADRPAGWITVEEPLLLGEAIDAISGDDTL